MDLNDIRSLSTLALFILFIVMVFQLFRKKNKKHYDDAANLPFSGDERSQKIDNTQEKVDNHE